MNPKKPTSSTIRRARIRMGAVGLVRSMTEQECPWRPRPLTKDDLRVLHDAVEEGYLVPSLTEHDVRKSLERDSRAIAEHHRAIQREHQEATERAMALRLR